jgi:hypothetical protein
MADLVSSAVSLQPTGLREAEFYGAKKGVFTRRVKLTSVTQGGSTNKLTATALGFKSLVSCGNFHQTSGTPAVIPAAVDPVNNILLLGAGASNAVGDVTAATGYIVITGT